MREPLAIRPAQASDFASVDRLFAESYPVLLEAAYPAAICAAAMPLISRAQPDLVRAGSVFLVSKGCRLLGAGGWTRGAPGSGLEEPGLGHIRHLVTHHRHQRQGIGRRLLDYLISHASGQGMSRLSCISTLNAVPFYAAMGFEVCEALSLPLAEEVDVPAVRMQRRL